MPRRPKKPCSYPGCPKLTNGRYCEEHQRQENRRYEQYQRNPATKKRYGEAWRRIRKKYAQTHPFCEQCFKNGVIVPVEEVHHIKPLSEGGTHVPGVNFPIRLRFLIFEDLPPPSCL